MRLTERQWNLEGYRVKKGEKGERDWTNGYRQQMAVYFDRSQVRKMTKKQHEKWLAEERKRKNEMARKRREKRKREEEIARKRAEEEKAEKEQAFEKLKTEGFKVVYVEIYGYGLWCYKVPDNTPVGTTGNFPFGDKMARGEVGEEVTKEGIINEYWFPRGLRRAKELDM